jgi:2-polyprenyl-3-methyl-5-hydroxy-6-metoxy-1,4-benzoquinol methylase
MRSLADRSREEEQMDAADLPAADLAAVLHDLARVNRITMSARPTIGFIGRALGEAKRFRLLDIGFGEGDMLRAIARWAARRGIAAELAGVDLNPNSAPAARAATPPGMAIDYRAGDYAACAGEGWDFVISSFVAHHMSDAQLTAYLRFSEDQSRIGWIVNDLHRHRLAYIGFPLLARSFGWHRIVREDGQLSIARSFRRDEWEAIIARAGLAPATIRIVRRFPFRLCVERTR